MTTISDTNTDTDRISRLEGAYEHLATKADLAQMETRLTWRLIGAVCVLVVAKILMERFL